MVVVLIPTRMKLKIDSTNSAAIDAALAAANGRASQHTAGVGDITSAATQAEAELTRLGLPASRRTGAIVHYTSGGSVPSSYKYQRTVTRARLIRGSSHWFLTEVSTASVWPNHKSGNSLTLTADQDAHLVAELRASYSVLPAPAPAAIAVEVAA